MPVRAGAHGMPLSNCTVVAEKGIGALPKTTKIERMSVKVLRTYTALSFVQLTHCRVTAFPRLILRTQLIKGNTS